MDADINKLSEHEMEKDRKVQIILHEHWEEHIGLDRRNGEPTGRTTRHDRNRKQSSQLIYKIKQKANEHGATISESSGKRKMEGILYYDGGVTYSVYTLLTFALETGGIAAVFLKFVKPLILQWMKNLAGRSVEVKVGDKEIRITGSNDIDKAIAALQALNVESSKGTYPSRGKKTQKLIK